jgi:endonuclease-3
MDEQILLERRKRAQEINEKLKELFPAPKIALCFNSHWELLVAVILSAQCTDKKVNEVTALLFKKYRTLDDYVGANPGEFEQDIKSTGFYKNKAKNILATARIIKEQFHGQVPGSMAELIRLPGVARKTANVVLGNAFGIVEGIAVDTHVRRLALKLGLTEQVNPDRIERELMQLLPKTEWFVFTYRLIEYGRNICPARKHACLEHPLSKVYPPAAHSFP